MASSSTSTVSTTPSVMRQITLSLVVLIVGLVLAWLLLTGKEKPSPDGAKAPLRPVVEVLEVEPRPISLTLETQGTVEPLHRLNLVTQVAGKVDVLSEQFQAGQFIGKGERLLQLEQDDYQFAIARARSAVAAAEQRLAEEQGRHRQARREWRNLGADEANALFLREPQLKAAQAALVAAKADLAAAELALERTTLRAPFDGRIETRRVDVGTYVTPGTVVGEFYGTDTMQVRLPLTDRELSSLHLSLDPASSFEQPVTLRARFGEQVWEWLGVIRRLEAVVDRDSRVIRAIAEVDEPFAVNTSGRPPLIPGTFVQASIPTPPTPGLVQLPAAALRADNTVLRVSPGNRLTRHLVTVHRRSNDWAWVSGLMQGDRVVAEQGGVLVSGMLVEVASRVTPMTTGGR